VALILNKQQIQQKIKRLAIQMVENHYGEETVILIGINQNGLGFAKMILEAIENISYAKPNFLLAQVKINPAAPLSEAIDLTIPLTILKEKSLIFVDDVANTGRTLFYAMKPIFSVIPKKLEVAVLVDRKHKSFPIHVDYVGLTIATTLSENIDVQIQAVDTMAVYLN
jgi:pyrimidine operon attenuation protein/uracil phosphoribosyltransferase